MPTRPLVTSYVGDLRLFPDRWHHLGLTVVVLFVLAFLPQFTDPVRPVLLQFLALGAVLSLGGLIVNGAVGVFAGGVGRRLAGSVAFNRWLGRVSASIFAGLALRLALLNKA